MRASRAGVTGEGGRGAVGTRAIQLGPCGSWQTPSLQRHASLLPVALLPCSTRFACKPGQQRLSCVWAAAAATAGRPRCTACACGRPAGELTSASSLSWHLLALQARRHPPCIATGCTAGSCTRSSSRPPPVAQSLQRRWSTLRPRQRPSSVRRPPARRRGTMSSSSRARPRLCWRRPRCPSTARWRRWPLRRCLPSALRRARPACQPPSHPRQAALPQPLPAARPWLKWPQAGSGRAARMAAAAAPAAPAHSRTRLPACAAAAPATSAVARRCAGRPRCARRAASCCLACQTGTGGPARLHRAAAARWAAAPLHPALCLASPAARARRCPPQRSAAPSLSCRPMALRLPSPRPAR